MKIEDFPYGTTVDLLVKFAMEAEDSFLRDSFEKPFEDYA